MNGLTATGVTVGICAGLWQLVSSHVGLSQGWELLGTIGFVAFCSFYAAGGGKSGFIRSLAVNYSGMVWAFFAALTAGWLASVSGLSAFLGERNYYRTLLGGSGLARAFLVTVLYSRWLSRHDAVFCQRDELDGDVTGFSGG
ncbi:inner membrane protein [Escherichia coli]|uniref:Inner membrane protein n=1 Tax=Escherichia coli TaxID=562 RepID=A0A377DWK9_ECOLX|nr:inner membrane protein [Escherichia coli]